MFLYDIDLDLETENENGLFFLKKTWNRRCGIKTWPRRNNLHKLWRRLTHEAIKFMVEFVSFSPIFLTILSLDIIERTLFLKEPLYIISGRHQKNKIGDVMVNPEKGSTFYDWLLCV